MLSLSLALSPRTQSRSRRPVLPHAPVLSTPMASAVRRQRGLLFGVSVQVPRPQRGGQARARGSAPRGPADGIGQPVDGVRMPPVAVPPEHRRRLRAMVSSELVFMWSQQSWRVDQAACKYTHTGMSVTLSLKLAHPILNPHTLRNVRTSEESRSPRRR